MLTRNLTVAKALIPLMFAGVIGAALAAGGCKKEEPATPPPKTPTTPAPPTRTPSPQASVGAGNSAGTPAMPARGTINPLSGTGVPAADAREDLRQVVTAGDAEAQAKLAQVTAAIDRKEYFAADLALKAVEGNRTSLSPGMQRTVQDLRSRLNALMATADNRPPASLPATRPR